MTETALPQPIPLPPDFPVAWERPEDSFSFWERETSHYPGQSPMLDCSLAARAITPGFNAGCEMFSFPVRNRTFRFNTFAYQTFEPSATIRRSSRRSVRRRRSYSAPRSGTR